MILAFCACVVSVLGTVYLIARAAKEPQILVRISDPEDERVARFFESRYE
jgi:hypothetical protein